MTTAQVVETSVTVNNNSPIQDYVHLDDQTQPFVWRIIETLTHAHAVYVVKKKADYGILSGSHQPLPKLALTKKYSTFEMVY